MREKLICRQCRTASSGRKSFVIPGSQPHYAPDLPFRLEHVLLDVVVDPKARTLAGTVTQRLAVVAPGKTWLKLDQVGLKIEAVEVGGKPAFFRVEGHTLQIRLAETVEQSPKVGSTFEVRVRYEVNEPKRGLYFTGPDADYPSKRYQVWSQGQDEDSRHWFPTLDYPNQKALSEVIATVPKGFTAVSNGALVEKREVEGGVRFHYRLGTPHVTYLIALTVAEFSEWEDKGPRGLPVQYYVTPGREADGKRAFGNTPRMIEAFESKIGVSYPYEKYSQVAVQDFIFGGMENTSATTQTDLTLHDARAHLDFTSDGLVSHELAHQWFGDLLTCRDWSHAWLNEGFATFMERVWIENNTDPDGGPEEAKYYQYQDLKDHLEEDSGHYRRPIVCNTYVEPIDLFDTHLYQKGGLVLNLLRATLGEDAFWKSIRLYVTRHRGQNVETLDLIRAIEETTGRNLRRFFDEWVFSAGYPELEITYSWNEEKKTAELVVEQKQTGGKPESVQEGVRTPIFHLSPKLVFTLEDGETVTEMVDIGEIRERVFLALPSKPKIVRFDPGATIPKTLQFARPKEMLIAQLVGDVDCMGRIEAIHELAKIPEPEAVQAIGRALREDAFWGVQAEAAEALGGLRTNSAKRELLGGAGVKSPKARRALARALGNYRDTDSSAALRKLAERDESYYVEAESTGAFARAGAYSEETEDFLFRQLEKSSYREVIRGGALRGLAELPGVARGERPRAVAKLMEFAKRGHVEDARGAAIGALGKVAREAIASERARVMEFLRELADEENFRVRLALIQALRASELPEAIPLLSKIHLSDPDGRVKRNAFSAMDELQTAGTTPESVSQLKTALQKLEEEHRKLRGWVEELRAASGKKD